MNWIEIVNLIVGIFGTVVGIVGGSVGIIYWRENKAIKGAEAQKSNTEARLAEADLAEKILEKYEKGILARMDSGEAVRQKEFSDLTQRIDQRFDIIEEEDRKQNETLQGQADTLRDVVEYLNGGFHKFQEKKRSKPVTRRKPAASSVAAKS